MGLLRQLASNMVQRSTKSAMPHGTRMWQPSKPSDFDFSLFWMSQCVACHPKWQNFPGLSTVNKKVSRNIPYSQFDFVISVNIYNLQNHGNLPQIVKHLFLFVDFTSKWRSLTNLVHSRLRISFICVINWRKKYLSKKFHPVLHDTRQSMANSGENFNVTISFFVDLQRW